MVRNLQRINDDAVRGGWSWKYEPSNFSDAAMSHYITPLVDKRFWDAVAKTRGLAKYEGGVWPTDDPASALMYSFMQYLGEGCTVDEALGKL